MSLPEAWLEEVRLLAEAAGDAIREIYHQPSRWGRTDKRDASPVTAADLAAHRLITAGLSRLSPGIPVLSEEAEPAPDRRAWTEYWLVDPLDGTREFIAGNPEFTVNIALVRHGEPVFGVVHLPCLEGGVSYAGASGAGAWKVSAGSREAIRVRKPGPCPEVLVSRSHRGERDERMIRQLAAAGCRIDYAGSSLKMCRIAEGRADFCPRTGPTMEWDTAAAQAVLVAAGGAMVDWCRRPLRYNAKESLVNPPFIALGDPDRIPWFLQATASDGPEEPA